MNVIPYIHYSSETITEKVPVVTTTYETRTKVVEKEEKLFKVDLTQEQVDVIVAITGNIIGGGQTRRLTDAIWSGLQKHASNEGSSSKKSYHFEDYFTVKESSHNEYGYIVTKE